MTLDIRAMRGSDLRNVAIAEHKCFDDPWSMTAIYQSYSHEYSLCRVAEIDATILGYLISYSIHEEGHLLNIAVLPEQRRMGIGRKLMEDWMLEGSKRNWEFAFLEVRAGNIPAIKLYEDFGFSHAGLRKKYYPDGEDAVLMTCNL